MRTTVFTVFASALALAGSQVRAIELDTELPITTAQGQAMLDFLDEDEGLLDLCKNGVKPKEIKETFFRKTGNKVGGGYAEEKPFTQVKLVPGLEEGVLKDWGKVMKKNKQVVNRVKVPKKFNIEEWAATVEGARPAFEAELAKDTPNNNSDAVKNFKAPVS